MNKICIAVLITCCLLWRVTVLAQGINFEHITLNEAISKAGNPAEPKLILVDCYTSWCIPCIEMASMEFPKKIAGDYFNPKFVSVKFDMEKGEGKEIAKKYNVKAYPTFLLLNAKGQEINRVVGKSTADEFIEKVTTALDPKNSLPGIKAAYEEKKGMDTGMPYALALYQNSQDPGPVLDELFENAQDFERFSKNYLELALGTTKFGSPFFRKLMLEKARIDLAMGSEVTNRIIFDKVRKDMYSIANENGARYNIFYTPKEVEEIAYTISLLKLDTNVPEHHMCRIALYVANDDLDGMIRYYKRYISRLRSDDVFKGILDGILSSKLKKATPEQYVAIKAYFQDQSNRLKKESAQYQGYADNIK